MKMTNTALRAENSNSRTITFKSREHEKFYEEYLKKCRYQDVYHRAWLLGVFIMLKDEIPFRFSIVSIFARDMFNHCHGNHLSFSSLHISFHKYPGEIFLSLFSFLRR